MDIEGAQFPVEDKQADGEEDITHPGHDKGLEGRRAVVAILVVEADQQVAAQPHPFPAEVDKQQVIGQYQKQHAGDKEVGVGEEAGVTLFSAHIPGGKQVNEETDPGHHPQHGQRQAIQCQREAWGKVAHRHPLPQALDIDAPLGRVAQKVDADPQGGEGRQANGAHPDQRRGTLAKPAEGEGQHQPSQQWK